MKSDQNIGLNQDIGLIIHLMKNYPLDAVIETENGNNTSQLILGGCKLKAGIEPADVLNSLKNNTLNHKFFNANFEYKNQHVDTKDEEYCEELGISHKHTLLVNTREFSKILTTFANTAIGNLYNTRNLDPQNDINILDVISATIKHDNKFQIIVKIYDCYSILYEVNKINSNEYSVTYDSMLNSFDEKFNFISSGNSKLDQKMRFYVEQKYFLYAIQDKFAAHLNKLKKIIAPYYNKYQDTTLTINESKSDIPRIPIYSLLFDPAYTKIKFYFKSKSTSIFLGFSLEYDNLKNKINTKIEDISDRQNEYIEVFEENPYYIL